MNRKLLIGCIALILMSLLSAFGFSTKLDYPLKKMKNDINNPYKISVDSVKREYYLHIPNNLSSNAPLIMIFHCNKYRYFLEIMN
jgi:poly(3-hydroxybutyrate) depolymerase